MCILELWATFFLWVKSKNYIIVSIRKPSKKVGSKIKRNDKEIGKSKEKKRKVKTKQTLKN